MTAPAVILTARALGFSWPDGPRLWSGLSFDVPAGVSLVQGDEGCGKTTLLKLLAGELPPSEGDVCLEGRSLSSDRQAHRQRVFRTDPRSVALQDVTPQAWFDALGRLWPRFGADALPELVDGFALGVHLHKPMYMLSSGSQRKVWLSAALAAGAPVTLLDEPFAALDMPSIRFLRECLLEASGHPTRAWVLADHTAPQGLPLASTITL